MSGQVKDSDEETSSEKEETSDEEESGPPVLPEMIVTLTFNNINISTTTPHKEKSGARRTDGKAARCMPYVPGTWMKKKAELCEEVRLD